MKIPDHIPKIILFPVLASIIVLAGIVCFRCRSSDRISTEPRFRMSDLDERAKPFIAEASAAVPDVIEALCSRRCHLYWLLLKDKCTGGTESRVYIASILEPRIIEPLRKAAAVYACAVNTDGAVGLTEDAAIDCLSRQLYATAGLAIEAVFIRATIDSAINVLCGCAPKLAASWGLAGACALADGPLPVGDVIGLTLAAGGTLWCCYDIVQAHRQLPANMTEALQSAVTATIVQCRLEAASAL